MIVLVCGVNLKSFISARHPYYSSISDDDQYVLFMRNYQNKKNKIENVENRKIFDSLITIFLFQQLGPQFRLFKVVFVVIRIALA